MGEVKAKSPPSMAPGAKLGLQRWGPEKGGVNKNCHSHTWWKPLFSHMDGSEPELQSQLLALLASGNTSRLELPPRG